MLDDNPDNALVQVVFEARLLICFVDLNGLALEAKTTSSRTT